MAEHWLVDYAFFRKNDLLDVIVSPVPGPGHAIDLTEKIDIISLAA